ncbi:hypothetical protein ACXZ1K_05205 [Pedobacter sp. PWIIR3]
MKKSILLLCWLMLMTRCSLMKKTTREQSHELQTTSATAGLSQLDLTKATKETNEYFYRTDGSLLGHKNIKEQVNQSGFTTAKIEKSATANKEVIIKDSLPSNTLIWIAGIGMVLVLLVVMRLLIKK